MRPDGDPEPDDYGLPRVDVVVPDDARELEREVLAYRREERQRRRRARFRRLLSPFSRFGVAVPIIAGALLIALLSGALMTAFGPRPAPRPTASLADPTSTVPPGRPGGPLPSGDVAIVNGKAERRRLADLRSGVLAIVPSQCACDRLIDELATRTRQYNLSFWLTLDRRDAPASRDAALRRLRALGGAAHGGQVTLLEDEQGRLADMYTRDAGKATTLLIRPDGLLADIVSDPRPGRELSEKIKALNAASLPVPSSTHS
ncbi:hypothetical protein [Spirillospora sp. NPDC047279]|uniref:hypothetical protein n=1 Tax=Spirillospora sp. NPDC047279 TaxID=3155478 RepID=UPI0033E13D86